MPNSDKTPPGSDRPGDEAWNVPLDEDFIRAATFKEGHSLTPPAPKRPRPVWPRNAAAALAAAALAFLALKALGPSDRQEDRAAAPASSSPAALTSTPAASRTTSVPSGSAVPLSARPMIALTEAFPAEVKDASGAVYTKVGAATLTNCTEPDSVGPRLISMINESKGCVGELVALYKDAQNNQFNLAVFTMKDPLDTVHLVTELTIAFDSYEVGAQAPPPGSGLATLPPDSGMVQAFTGQGRAMVVGLGQWSDGRTADFQKLVDRLEPLLKSVSGKVADYENQR
ncbi:MULTISPECIES: hypothetical protein [unclassified Kitasatospora]|uniref:hypothetical protein n=1 Tax=unclassified Kitasatospora TaxID=2633591 RepID=UPI0007104353|nr:MULTISPECIES: hypothetical protein [unclassified Kitasatospora]KQV24024.1 hypothetical protein ASC99_02140 [Kitasatospora sp. Root107]KRB67262.1 hypothetical protein ASE03_02600 [Kitasatospora sp. Root187]